MLTSNNFTRGLNQDVHPKFQPEGTYRSALNAVLESREGDLLTISNELGNDQVVTGYPADKKIIGHRLLNDGTTVLFLFDPDTGRPDHEIGIYDPKKLTYTTYKMGECLNFSNDHYINAIYRLKNGCERIVYFTDNYNPYRVINLDRPEYYGPGTNLTSCDKLKYSRDYKLPSFSASVANSNGALEVGSYMFAYRLLDVDRNPTNWLIISNPVGISPDNEILKDDPLTVSKFDGAVANEGETGFVPPTTKSVDLTLSNVDTRFEFVQLAAIKYTASSGAVTGVDILTPEPIPDTLAAATTMNVRYTGYNSQVESQTSLDEILSSKVFLDKVVTHEQKDGRLFVANLVTENKDYTGFQRHASSIKAEYVETFVDIDDANSKGVDYYFGDGSFLHDEVYPYGIVYVWTDGTISPVFHIPGRPMIDNTGDTYGTHPYITTNKDEWDSRDVTGDVNIFNDDKTDRWQVYNTYTDYGGSHNEGLMGYYETDTTYPDITDCDDDHVDGYWGRDWTGTLIEPGDPIRHHRMPAFARAGLSASNYNRRLGVKFTMTQNYPSTDIIGHYYVYGDRSFEKTVVDTGIIAPVGGDNFNHGTGTPPADYAYTFSSLAFHYPSSQLTLGPTRLNEPYYAYISANTLYNEKLPTANYLAINKLYGSPTVDDQQDVGGLLNEQYDEFIYSKPSSIVRHEPWTNATEINYKLLEQDYVPAAGSADGGVTDNVPLVDISANSAVGVFKNLSISTNVGLLRLDREFPEVTNYTLTNVGWPINMNDFFYDRNTFYVSLKADTVVFRELSTIQYRRIGSALLAKSTGITHTAELYDGDIFLSPLDIVDLHWFLDGTNKTARCEFSTALIENPINLGLRHGDDTEYGKYTYYKMKNTDTAATFLLYIAQKYYEPTEDTFAFHPELHLYNEAYTQLNSLERLLPLPADYDYCNDCLERFPYRVMYSQADDIERRKDSYLVIYPNNYRDADGNAGPILDMFVNYNELYINTPYSPYHVPTNPQVLTTTDNTNVYLGSGGVLPQPFRPIKNVDTPAGGSSYWKSRISTELGTVYVDDVAGRVYLLSDRIHDLSAQGMRAFWRDNGVVKLAQQFEKLAGVPYDKSCLANDYGVGFTSVYDPIHKRVIIHKRDYKLRKEYEDNFVYATAGLPVVPSGTVVFYNGKFYLQKGATIAPVSLSNGSVFENHSFTISYSLIAQAWISFHSYLPYYMFNDSQYFYSSDIYQHNIGDYQTFFDYKYDHMIDLIAVNNPYGQLTTTSLQYSSSVVEPNYNSSIETNLPITFDRLIVYNSDQSTGLQDIIVKDTPFLDDSSSSVQVRKVDKRWRINNLRDYATPNQPVWSYNWLDKQTSPFIWIDRVPINIDYNRSLFESERISDFYTGVRLFFNPAQNAKIVTDLITTTNANKNR